MANDADTSSLDEGTGLDAAAKAFEAILDREDGTQPQKPPKSAPKAPARAEAARVAKADETPDEDEDEEEADEADPEDEAEDDAAEDDDAEDEEDQDDDGKAPAKVTVKIDGKTEELPLDEVVKGYQRQADYSRKTEALAQERRAFQSEAEQVRVERQQYATLLQSLSQQLETLQEKEPDWDRLWQEDPLEWTRQRAFKDDRDRKVSAARYELERMQAQAAQEQAEQMRQMLQSERAKLPELVPEARSPEKWEATRKQLREYGQKVGYTAEELSQAYDARAIAVLTKAMKYDALMSAKAPKPKAADPAPAPSQGTARTPRPVSQLTRDKQRLAKTGRVSDAAKVFEGLI